MTQQRAVTLLEGQPERDHSRSCTDRGRGALARDQGSEEQMLSWYRNEKAEQICRKVFSLNVPHFARTRPILIIPGSQEPFIITLDTQRDK